MIVKFIFIVATVMFASATLETGNASRLSAGAALARRVHFAPLPVSTRIKSRQIKTEQSKGKNLLTEPSNHSRDSKEQNNLNFLRDTTTVAPTQAYEQIPAPFYLNFEQFDDRQSTRT